MVYGYVAMVLWRCCHSVIEVFIWCHGGGVMEMLLCCHGSVAMVLCKNCYGVMKVLLWCYRPVAMFSV